MTRESRMDDLTAKSDNHGLQSMLPSCDTDILKRCRKSKKVIVKVIKWKGSYF